MNDLKTKRYLLGGILLLSTAVALAQTPTYDAYAGWYKQWNDSLKGAHITAAQRFFIYSFCAIWEIAIAVSSIHRWYTVSNRAMRESR